MGMETDAQRWAQTMFGGCELSDARRTRRVVTMAADRVRAAFVATHHVFRIALIVITAPLLFRLLERLGGRVSGAHRGPEDPPQP